MIFSCPVTGLVWGALPGSKINATLRVAHPLLTSPLVELRNYAQAWEGLTEEDKRLLWVATLTASPLLKEVRGSALRPTAALVEATFPGLLQLTTWALTQTSPRKIMPMFVPASPDCENIKGWLSACYKAKRDWQEDRDSYAAQLEESANASRMDRALQKYQAANRVGVDTLPASLVKWLLTASEVSEGVTALWKQMLCSTSEQLTLSGKVSLADIDECLEHFECWEHPTLLRIFAVKQLKAKAIYLSKNSLDGEANLDFLITTPVSPANAFTLLVSEPSAQHYISESVPLTQADRVDTLRVRQAEMATLARARLASILGAAKQQGAKQNEPT